MNVARVRPRNGANLGAKRRRLLDPASICNDEWAHLVAPPKDPSVLGHSGASAIHFVNMNLTGSIPESERVAHELRVQLVGLVKSTS